MIPCLRHAVAGDCRAESDAASVGKNIPVPAAIAALDHGDSSAVPLQVDEQSHDKMDNEYIPEIDADHDGDKRGERPAIWRQTCNNMVTIPQRSTQWSPL